MNDTLGGFESVALHLALEMEFLALPLESLLDIVIYQHMH
jgi:hypothetical protein